MTVRVRNLQVDVAPDDHDDALAWWAMALGGSPRASDGPYTHLDGVRSRVGVHVQRLDEGPGGYHLDLETDGDLDGEVARLVDAGAVALGHAGGWEGARLMEDPAGLRFCVTRVGQEQHLSDQRDRAHLRVLMLDVPAAQAAAEATFWAVALAGEATPVGERFPAYTWVHGVEGPGGPTNLAVQAIDEGPARIHVDLHCPDTEARDREVARLVDGGGTELSRGEGHWVVLRAPGDHLACVVPDQP